MTINIPDDYVDEVVAILENISEIIADYEELTDNYDYYRAERTELYNMIGQLKGDKTCIS